MEVEISRYIKDNGKKGSRKIGNSSENNENNESEKLEMVERIINRKTDHDRKKRDV